MVQLYGCQMMNTTERGNTSWGAAGGETPPIQRLGGAGQRERAAACSSGFVSSFTVAERERESVCEREREIIKY